MGEFEDAEVALNAALNSGTDEKYFTGRATPKEKERPLRLLDNTAGRSIYMSAVDEASDNLTVALSKLIDVKSYIRRSKTGKAVHVDSYKRKVLGKDLKIGDVVKDAFGKQQTVASVTPQSVVFKSGATANIRSSFEKINAPQSVASTTKPDLPPTVNYPKGTGYNQRIVKRAGNPGASVEQAASALVEKVGGKRRPLTDEEYAAHTQMIEREIGQALAEGRSTDRKYAIDLDAGIWETERAAQHKKIAQEMWAAAGADNVPNEGRAKISGGLGGAGKGTVLKSLDANIKSDFFTVNSDDVKEFIGKNYPEMIPEAGSLSPLERAALIHEESSHIADLLAARAYAEKKNMIWDITMASRGSTVRRIDDLRKNGYTEVEALFVDIDVETSVSRALSRHRNGMERYRNGEGEGGRYVPPAVIRKNESDVTSSANRETFDSIKNMFDKWTLFNNNVDGRSPVREAEGNNPLANSVNDPFVNQAS